MSKIILFNAPKVVGKSEAIKYLKNRGFNLINAECKEPLHNLTMTLFGVSPERYWEIYNTRELKEVPLEDFTATLSYKEVCTLQDLIGRWTATSLFGSNREVKLSIREAMVCVSEVVVKPRWGEGWFGKERVRTIKKYEGVVGQPDKLLFCDDSCAFVDELDPLIEYLGQENILLLRIHRDGFTFDGDSRDYIPDGIIKNTVDVYNNGTEQEYFDKVEGVINKWLNK